MRGHELSLKHWLGADNNVMWDEEPAKGLVDEIKWHEDSPVGKLDFLVNLNIRMDSTAIIRMWSCLPPSGTKKMTSPLATCIPSFTP